MHLPERNVSSGFKLFVLRNQRLQLFFTKSYPFHSTANSLLAAPQISPLKAFSGRDVRCTGLRGEVTRTLSIQSSAEGKMIQPTFTDPSSESSEVRFLSWPS